MSNDKISITPVTFCCENETLVGILSQPANPQQTGVLIIVGGPQYRIGSHRHFFELAGALAHAGIPAFRFDVRGMGDSSGDLHTFESTAPDIKAAIDAFFCQQPGLQKVVLWGLCDAASAALFYAHKDPRIEAMILLNPWARTESGEAKAYLKHYYRDRILQKSFWLKLMGGGINPIQTFKSFLVMIKKAKSKSKAPLEPLPATSQPPESSPLPERMLYVLKSFSGKVLFILSGDDLTGQEFSDLISSNPDWKEASQLNTTTIEQMNDADHTFSSSKWKVGINELTISWVKSL